VKGLASGISQQSDASVIEATAEGVGVTVSNGARWVNSAGGQTSSASGELGVGTGTGGLDRITVSLAG
jgi:hypothetical protein